MQNLVSLFNRPSENAPVVAKLGKKNEMYFNKELKRWIEPGNEDEVRREMQKMSAPPPKPSAQSTSKDTPSEIPVSAVDRLCQVVSFYSVGSGAREQTLSRPKIPSLLPNSFPNPSNPTCFLQNESALNEFQDQVKTSDTNPFSSKLSPSKQHSLNFTTNSVNNISLIDSLRESPEQNFLPKENFSEDKTNPYLNSSNSPIDQAGSSLGVPLIHSVEVTTNESDTRIQQIPNLEESAVSDYPTAYSHPLSPRSELGRLASCQAPENEVKHVVSKNDSCLDQVSHYTSNGIQVNNNNIHAARNVSQYDNLRASIDTDTNVVNSPQNKTLNQSETLSDLDRSNAYFSEDEQKRTIRTSNPLVTLSSQIALGSHQNLPERCGTEPLASKVVTSDNQELLQKLEKLFIGEPPIGKEKTCCDEPVSEVLPGKVDVPQETESHQMLKKRKGFLHAYKQQEKSGIPKNNSESLRIWDAPHTADLDNITIEYPIEDYKCTINKILVESESLIEDLEKQVLICVKLHMNQNSPLSHEDSTKRVHDSIKEFKSLSDGMMERCEKNLKDLSEKIHIVTSVLVTEHEEETVLCSMIACQETVSKGVKEQENIQVLVHQLGLDVRHLMRLMKQLSRNQANHYLQLLRQSYIEKEEKINECRQAHQIILDLSDLLQRHNNSWRVFTESCVRSMNHHYQEGILKYEKLLASQKAEAEERLLLEQISLERLTKGFEELLCNEKKQEERLRQKISSIYTQLKAVKYENIAMIQQKEETISKLSLEKQDLENDIAEVHEKYEARLTALKVQYTALQVEYQQLQIKLNQAMEHSSSLTVELLSVKEEHQKRLHHLTSQYEAETRQLRERVSTVTSEKSVAENRCTEMLEQIEKLRSEKDCDDSKNQEISLRNKQLESVCAKLEAEKLELTSDLNRLENQCNSLSNERMKLLSEIQIQSENMGKEAQAFIKDKEKAVTSLKSQIDALEQQLSAVALEKDMAKRELEEYTREVSHRIVAMEESRNNTEKTLRQSLSDLQEKYDASQAELRNFEIQVSKDVNESDAKLHSLEADLKEALSQNKHVAEECDILRSENNNLNDMCKSLTSRLNREQEERRDLLETFYNSTLINECDLAPCLSQQASAMDTATEKSLEALQESWDHEKTSRANHQETSQDKLEKTEAQLEEALQLLKKTQDALEVTTQKQKDSTFMLAHMAYKWDILLQYYPHISREIDAHVPSSDSFDTQ